MKSMVVVHGCQDDKGEDVEELEDGVACQKFKVHWMNSGGSWSPAQSLILKYHHGAL